MTKSRVLFMVFICGACCLAVSTTYGQEGQEGQDETNDTAYSIRTMHLCPFFLEVCVASVSGWMLGVVKGFKTSETWLGRYWANVPKPFLFVVDLLVFVILGAYFGTGIFQPSSFVEAIAAGVSWPVALGALASEKRS